MMRRQTSIASSYLPCMRSRFARASSGYTSRSEPSAYSGSVVSSRRREPHSIQNALVSGISAKHFGQVIVPNFASLSILQLSAQAREIVPLCKGMIPVSGIIWSMARLLWSVLWGFVCIAAWAQQTARPVYHIQFKEIVHRASADYLMRAHADAVKANAGAFMVLLDTPGGELQATRDITTTFLNSPIPVIVFVYPSGSRAGSAGVFITVAANVAAMAPGTNIGAATPVSGDGQEIPQDLRRKVMNDTIAYAKTIAEQRGRNKDWVVKAVTEAASITEQEALRNKVIDIVASSPQELLVAIDGRKVKVAGGKTLTLRTKDAPFQEIPKNWRESLLMFLAHPNVFYILMLLAIYGILGELQNPGATYPGVIGAIALLLALYAASVLPVNALGVALILLAFALFVAELFTTSHGVLTAGALVSFAIGSIILFQSDSPVFRVSLWLIGTMTALTGGLFLFVAYSGIRAQFRRKVSGQERLIGMIGRARTKLAPEGMVFVDGTLWRAIALDPPIEAGEYVQVDRVDGLTLYVRWQPAPAPTSEERESARA
jgi:membrane-bound serine protease (ClpP class)